MTEMSLILGAGMPLAAWMARGAMLTAPALRASCSSLRRFTEVSETTISLDLDCRQTRAGGRDIIGISMTPKTDDSPALPPWLLAVASAAMLVALYMIFMWVSTEATMGIIQRIFYFHVPAATVSFWAVFVGGVASLLYLKTRDSKYDDLALAANESIVVFEAINIMMGSIWGRRVWGIWWTWDARLTSSFLLILIYMAYVIVRRAVAAEQRPTICA